MLLDMQADEIVAIEKDKIKLTRFNYKNDNFFEKGTTKKVKAETSTPIKLDDTIPSDFMFWLPCTSHVGMQPENRQHSTQGH